MQDLSLHVLDIAENSIRAKASLIQIHLMEDEAHNELKLVIQDNGKGMEEEILQKVTSPFFTTRTTRKVGLGIALLKHNCEQSGGTVIVESKPGEGTKIIATMQYDHIDRLPIGNMLSTIIILIGANPEIEWVYDRCIGERRFELDTRKIKEILEGVPINQPDILNWLKDYMAHQESEIFYR